MSETHKKKYKNLSFIMKTSSSTIHSLPVLLEYYPFKVETPELETFSSIWNGEVLMACKVLRHTTQQTAGYSQSQDPIFSRVYFETTKPLNAAISYNSSLYFHN